MTYSSSIFATDSFWTLVALIIFLLILYVLKIPHLILSKLDERSLAIAKELEEARLLKEEAKQKLIACQEKYKAAEQEAQQLLERAGRESQQIINDARAETDRYIEQQRRLVDEKMKISLAEASKEIKDHAVDLIVNAAKEVLCKEVNEEKQRELFSNKLDEIKQKTPSLS